MPLGVDIRKKDGGVEEEAQIGNIFKQKAGVNTKGGNLNTYNNTKVDIGIASKETKNSSYVGKNGIGHSESEQVKVGGVYAESHSRKTDFTFNNFKTEEKKSTKLGAFETGGTEKNSVGLGGIKSEQSGQTKTPCCDYGGSTGYQCCACFSGGPCCGCTVSNSLCCPDGMECGVDACCVGTYNLISSCCQSLSNFFGCEDVSKSCNEWSCCNEEQLSCPNLSDCNGTIPDCRMS